MDEETLFQLALDRPAGDRASFVDAACGDDERLKRRVHALLAAHEDPGSFLAQPAVPASRARESPGSRIGPYKLLQAIGEGGMGAVYMAEQEEPVRRRVALKIIRAGLDSRDVLARFEAERQALALMDHPNIARVLDAGATGSGRPYFVMELVKGTTIHEYCDRRRLTPRERLRLFIPVCQALQHAHQKGVIHRDIKPSNVLVAQYDGRPVPKVIDFGVAKATGARLTDRTMFTAFGQVLGTLEYMSPEQAELNELDVDTRSDIYSLGVLLYRLLTGTTPLEAERVRDGAFLEVLRIIREEEPPKPSTRLSTAEDLPLIAANRGLDPARLGRQIQGDLDWIVMKALEKDRARRYETASAFANDLERYLADEPVLARPPSAGYRLRKFVRRHKGAVGAVALLVASLVAGIVGTTMGLLDAERSRVREAQQKGAAERAAAAERGARELAEARLAEIQKANRVLKAIFTDLHPQRGPTDRPLRELLGGRLDAAAEELHADAAADPLNVVILLGELGETMRWLGYSERALVHLRRVQEICDAQLPADDPRRLTNLNNLGLAYGEVGRWDLAVERFEASLRDMPDDAGDLAHLVEQNLASAYLRSGRPADALELLVPLVELRRQRLDPQDPELLRTRAALAEAHAQTGRLDLAVPELEETVAKMVARSGAAHPDTIHRMNELGRLYIMAGRASEAVPLLERALESSRTTLGPEHVMSLTSLVNLAAACFTSWDLDRALRLNEEAVELAPRVHAADHPLSITTIANLGECLYVRGELERSVTLYDRALELVRGRPGPMPAEISWLRPCAALVYAESGLQARAEAVLREHLAIAGESPESVLDLARALVAQGKESEAEPLLGGLLSSSADDEAWLRYDAMSLLGACRLAAGDNAGAEPLLTQGYAGLKEEARQLPANRPGLVGQALERLVALQRAAGREEQARRFREDEIVGLCLIARKHPHPRMGELLARSLLRTAADRAEVHGTLGSMLAARGRIDEAEAAFEEALRLDEGWADVHTALGHLLAMRGRWKAAADAVRRGLDCDPSSPSPWCAWALLLRAAGDAAGAREACTEIRGRFGTLEDPLAAGEVATTCALLGSVDEGVLELARRGTTSEAIGAYMEVILALALLREGRPEEALARVKDAAPADAAHVATARIVEALAEQARGRREKAAQALAAARAIVDRERPGDRRDRWQVWLRVDLLSREAAEAIR